MDTGIANLFRGVSLGRGNAFMFIAMAWLGVLLVVTLIIADASLHLGLIVAARDYLQGAGLDSASPILVGVVAVFTLHALGLATYLVSFVFLGAPAMLLFESLSEGDRFSQASTAIADRIILKNSAMLGCQEAAESLNYAGGTAEKQSLLYLAILSKNDTIASEMKFLFAQLMFARAIGFTMVVAVAIVATARPSLLWIGLFVLFYAVSILAYRGGLRFFARTLVAAYIAGAQSPESSENVS